MENTLDLHLALLSTFYTKWKLSWKIYEIRQNIRLYKCTLYFLYSSRTQTGETKTKE